MKKIDLSEEFFRSPIAHRGLHDCNESFGSGKTENSLSAIQEAINKGYGIEVDIQLSEDNIPIVFHDYSLRRLVGRSELIKGMLAKDLESIRLPNGDTIPCLESVLDLVSGRVPLLIEIKDQDGKLGHKVGRMEKEVAKALKCYEGPIALMSFNPCSVKKIAEYLPNLPRGLITESFVSANWPEVDEKRLKGLRKFTAIKNLELSFISHEFTDLQNGRMIKLSEGLPRFCWTVRNAHEANRAFDIVDNITFEGFYPTGKNLII